MSQLQAQTQISDPAIRAVMDRLREEHGEDEIATGIENQWEFHTYYGRLQATLDSERVSIRVLADDETRLSYMKMAVAGHIAEHLGSTRGIRWQGDGVSGGTPTFFREVTVVSSEQVTPHLQRLRFRAGDLARFATGGLHMRLLLPPRDRRPVWPTVGEDGLLVWPSGEDALVVRIYTIRRINVAEGWFDVDFVLHAGDDTPAATFAQTATPGTVIGMIGPGGGGVPEDRNLLLFGDDTAIPAIARILESIAPETRADVFLEVDGAGDELPLASGDNISVRWLHRDGQEPGTAGLLSKALKDIDPAGLPDDFYVWAACEFGDFHEIRTHVRKQWGLNRERHMVVSYWRRGVQGNTRDE